MDSVQNTAESPSKLVVSAGPKEMGATITSWSGSKEADGRYEAVSSAAKPGFCYLRVLLYFNWFDSSNKEDLDMYIMCLTDRLGKDPEGIALLTELAVAGHNHLHSKPLYFDIEEGMVGSVTVVTIYNLMKESTARVNFTQVDGLIHLHGRPTLCSCGGPVCQHGWTYTALSVVIAKPGRRVGASGFDMNAFLNGGVFEEDEEEEDNTDFENAYSVLSMNDKAREKVASWVPPPLSVIPERQTESQKQSTSESPSAVRPSKLRRDSLLRHDSEEMQTQSKHDKFESRKGEKSLGRAEMSDIVRKMVDLEALKRANKLNDLQEEIKVLRQNLMSAEVTSSKAQDDEGTVVSTVFPGDSSTQIGRYRSPRKFIHTGTVIASEQPNNEYGRRSGQTVLTVQDSMISGFYHDDVTRQREADHVGKLKPINGLPKPFLSTRLNFLANLHTALTRCLSKAPDDYVSCLLSFLRVRPVIPVDELLYQVLQVSVDRHEFVYASNPFKLPYIEIGMFISEESIAKLLSLLTGEYKSLWFQEMKGLTVPDFHDEFYSKSHDPVDRSVRKRRGSERPSSDRATPQRTQKRSILGF